jgi:hypothetical protein
MAQSNGVCVAVTERGLTAFAVLITDGLLMGALRAVYVTDCATNDPLVMKKTLNSLAHRLKVA